MSASKKNMLILLITTTKKSNRTVVIKTNYSYSPDVAVWGMDTEWRATQPQSSQWALSSSQLRSFPKLQYLAGESRVKGTMTRDFQPQVFFVNQIPPGPWASLRGHFEFLRKFTEKVDHRCQWHMGKCFQRCQRQHRRQRSPMSKIPAINVCTGEKHLVRDFNWSPVSLTPAIFYLRWQRHRRLK